MIRNKNLEGINELRINLENKIEDLEKMFDEVRAVPLCLAFLLIQVVIIVVMWCRPIRTMWTRPIRAPRNLR